jgi:hypothetical protein
MDLFNKLWFLENHQPCYTKQHHLRALVFKKSYTMEIYVEQLVGTPSSYVQQLQITI